MSDKPKRYWRLKDNQGKPFMWNGKTDRIPNCPMDEDEAAAFARMQSDGSSQNVIGVEPCDPPA